MSLELYLGQVVDSVERDTPLALAEELAWAVALPPGYAGSNPGGAWRRLLHQLLRDPQAGQLRALLLIDWSEAAPDPCDIDFESGDPRELLRRHGGRLERVERLFMGRRPSGGVLRGSSEGYVAGAGEALARLPALRHLHVRGERCWDVLPPEGHPRLQRLLIHAEDTGFELLEALEGAPLPALEVLDLWAGEEVSDALLDAEAPLAALFSGKLLPRLRRLGLRGLEASGLEAAAQQLQASPLGGGLRRLDLTHCGDAADAAVSPLLKAPWLPGLEVLDLRGAPGLSEGLRRDLAARGPRVLAGPLSEDASLLELACS